ncbi:unnamed protein product [Taenia asiatica]|uniref:DUF5727 domain-containing protein n=1 Tax=Taenia asiatica TaxID=60517 RepID=A0A0R3WFH8_TAEAS|nr:unnamed protein product [Taenia asiatica]
MCATRKVLPAFHPPFAVAFLVSCRASFTTIITKVKNGDGFLHVTLDRLLFVMVSQGRKPEHIASWNFTNSEISVCDNGRVAFTLGFSVPHDLLDEDQKILSMSIDGDHERAVFNASVYASRCGPMSKASKPRV